MAERPNALSQPVAPDGCCNFYVAKKRRFCKMTVSKGNRYCGEHLVLDPNCRDRIKCPLDPSHSVAANKLAFHLTVCSAQKERKKLLFVREEILKFEQSPDSAGILEGDQHYLRLLASLFERYSAKFPIDVQPFPTESKGKHAVQVEAIAKTMKESFLLLDNSALIELCAGKGDLSRHVAQNCGLQDLQFILVDSGSFKHKKDCLLEYAGHKYLRIKSDIKNVDYVEAIAASGKRRASFYGKHACGTATDLALHSFFRAIQLTAASVISGLCIALCCYHRCKWDEYFGKPALVREFHGDEVEARRLFSKLLFYSGWATCAFKREKLDHHTGLSAGERAEIGQKSKRLLDFFRMTALNEKCPQKTKARLVQYADASVTLENVLLLISTE